MKRNANDLEILLKRAMEGEEELNHERRTVSDQSKELLKTVARTALTGPINDPIPVKIFDEESKRYVERDIVVHDVQNHEDLTVYSVSTAGQRDFSLTEFLITYGEFRDGAKPREMYYLSFNVVIEPLPDPTVDVRS